MLYIDWEYYSSLFENVAQDDFERMNKKACAKLDVITHLRARQFEESYNEETATPFQKKVHMQIRNTVCELINAMSIQEMSGMGSGIVSVSNSGYSETYKVTTQAEKETELCILIREGLSGTGLAGAL